MRVSHLHDPVTESTLSPLSNVLSSGLQAVRCVDPTCGQRSPARRRCRGGQPVRRQGRGDRADSAVDNLRGRRVLAGRLHAKQHGGAWAHVRQDTEQRSTSPRARTRRCRSTRATRATRRATAMCVHAGDGETDAPQTNPLQTAGPGGPGADTMKTKGEPRVDVRRHGRTSR